MVNVGGRSKGCSSCRRRRIKCDENQPVCNQCKRHGLECTGVRGITFVQGTIVKSRRTEKRVQVVSRNESHGAGRNDAAIPQAAPFPLLNVNDIEVYVCYFQAQPMLRDGPVAQALQQVQYSELVQNTATRKVFPQALVSFATVYFGTRHGQASIVNHGYVIFGRALKQLNEALSQPNCYTHDEVIVAVVTLALFECWVPSGSKNYLKHMAGVEKLLELRGPNPASFELYKGVRHMILFASLRTQKASILARAEWKKAFRINCSDEELQEQDLYDVLADCTALVAERDEKFATLEHERSINWYDKIEEKALDLLTQLYAWKRRWDTDPKNSHLEVVADRDKPPPFLTIFALSSDSTATILLLYNSVLIYVLQILATINLHSEAEYYTAKWLAALDICRCIPYYLIRESHVDLRVVHLAIVTAWTAFRGRETAEGRRLMDVLNNKHQEVFAKGLWSD